MTQEHTSHKYGFFKEVAPKHREKILNELSIIENQESSVSSTLGEIAAVESRVDDYAQKCQDDIDRAFEEMFANLQKYQQEMKAVAAAYYNSVTDVFDQQKEQLRIVQSGIKEVVSSANVALQGDNQNIFGRSESMSLKMESLQKKLQIVTLTVAKPQLIALTTRFASADSLQNYMSSKCFFYELAYAEMCSVDRSFANAKLYVNQSISFIITLRESNGGVCREGQDRVDADLVNITGKTTKGSVQYLSQGRVKIILTAERQGQHQLNVKVNRAHIKNSPFNVAVFMPPNRLLQPIATISGLDQPCGLKCCRDKVLATEIKKGRIIEIDSYFNVKEFIQLSGATELTPDSDLNIYVSTSDHRVHKVSKDGRIIKTVGQLGKRNAEFNFPNGLRVSKTESSMYVTVTTTEYRYLIWTLILSDHLERKGQERDRLTFQQTLISIQVAIFMSLTIATIAFKYSQRTMNVIFAQSEIKHSSQ